jgi:hypothetical protein
MLGDQRSPYVGRFACGWRRLPEEPLPGNHRPRRKPAGSIATGRNGPPERPRGGEDPDFHRARIHERRDAGRGGGPGGQDVVDEDHAGGRPSHGPKHSHERLPPVGAGAAGLGWRLPGSLEEWNHGKAARPAHRLSQHAGLVESALPPAAATQWHPAQPGERFVMASFGPRRPGRGHGRTGHGGAEGIGQGSKPGELQPDQRRPDGAVVDERRPCPGNGRRRAIRARLDLAVH